MTMARIAAAVGCSAPALYGHFRNRDALLRAVHDAGFEQLVRDKVAVAAQTAGDPIGRLREGGRAYVAFALDNPALYHLMFNPPPLPEFAGNPFEHDAGMASLLLLRRAVEAAQAAGYLPAEDADRVAFILWSTVHGAVSLMLQNRAPHPAADRQALGWQVVDSAISLITSSRASGPSRDA
ncbi:Transcriptional regulator, TetR family [Caenispirillum salinarum AK4]|uniref:Transcriptional regulator, TetR family n=1 Tax=Caenispirillum salinarum AK4 TaxID=1238182 RepID=K9GUF8_9PROT|nr:Transcriptional regulator, TetR family [Caenispirillum salinarum AK4]